jgi:hypothetical protein
MSTKHRFLLWFISTGMALATPAGVLTWNGNPQVLSCQGIECFNVQPSGTSDGIDTFYSSIDPGTWTGALFDVERQFTVTSGGGFLISTDVSVTGFGEESTPMGEPWTLDVGFDTPGASVNQQESPSDNWVPLTVSGGTSNLVILAPGVYQLDQNVEASISSGGVSQLSLATATDIVGTDPVLEPRWVAVIFIVALLARRLRG